MLVPTRTGKANLEAIVSFSKEQFGLQRHINGQAWFDSQTAHAHGLLTMSANSRLYVALRLGCMYSTCMVCEFTLV